MKASIRGLGQWLPESIRTNDAWPADFVQASARRAGDRTLVDLAPEPSSNPSIAIAARHLAVEEKDPFLGTTQRRVADPAMTSCEAELGAARAALADAGISAQEIDMVVSWTAVPDRVSAASASWVAHALGATRAFAMGLDAACASAVLQMAHAAAMIQTGQIRYALLTQSHLMTRAFPMGHPASPNVGDAATAMIMGPGKGHRFLGSVAHTQGQYHDAIVWTRGPEHDLPWYEAGKSYYPGSKDRSHAQYLASHTVCFGAQTVRELLAKLDAPVHDIGALTTVQPRRWTPGAIAEALGLAPDIAPHTFDELAHVGGVGPVINLIAGRRQGLLREGSLVAVYAQGAGFTRAAALIRW